MLSEECLVNNCNIYPHGKKKIDLHYETEHHGSFYLIYDCFLSACIKKIREGNYQKPTHRGSYMRGHFKGNP